ncbi:penicillin-binding protein 1C [Roseospirillum parvum]|uniref:peptidoglycan glycosyltransferase n=1 Tax=Roseospirillum parvum TaxID=83401 RepID=A0A1G7WBE7_9PROT|nr:penicillin-binding protein 1C [Roseospirillum parvum]SDG69099.1 penicillin-binding protein 1C [Roseospirillum parvum]
MIARRLLAGGIGLAGLAGLFGPALLVDWLAARPLSRALPAVSSEVVAGDGTLLRPFLSPDGRWRLAVAVAEVDPFYRALLKAREDRRFGQHPGVDAPAVLRAAGQNLLAGGVVSGASTLAMQVARRLDPAPRTLAAKLRETARALALTRALGDDGVLRAYLTLAPFGGNLEGVRAGSLAWLGKPPARLSPAEAALLVALPQAPERLRPDRHPEAARRARDRVLAVAVEAGLLSAAEAARAAAEPLPSRRHALPRLAPHVARELVETAPGPVVRTTLDAALQVDLEALVAEHVAGLDAKTSAALVAVDLASFEVRAVVGSPGLLETARQGAVDMSRAVRSPGSTLKPLIYGLAFADGLAHPKTLIDDVPTRFGSYRPTNFSGGYLGQVTVGEALALSLNVPAVKLLARVGPARLAARLTAAGVTPRLPGEAPPGLALALGGVGVTLREMTGLYAMLGTGGRWRPPALTPRPAEAPPVRQLLDPVAAWEVGQILRTAPPPPGFLPGVAVKTGTSYGYRDAWALGFDGGMAIGVWVGRADGSPSPGRIGRDTAAPLLFKAFARLPGDDRRPPPPPPGRLVAASAADLPPALARFEPPTPGRGEGPRLGFPSDGLVLDWAGARRGVTLEAAGGQAPLTWLVDGRPLADLPGSRPGDWRRPARWQPQGPGAARLTVVDAAGRAASATVWLRREGPGPARLSP